MVMEHEVGAPVAMMDETVAVEVVALQE